MSDNIATIDNQSGSLNISELNAVTLDAICGNTGSPITCTNDETAMGVVRVDINPTDFSNSGLNIEDMTSEIINRMSLDKCGREFLETKLNALGTKVLEGLYSGIVSGGSIDGIIRLCLLKAAQENPFVPRLEDLLAKLLESLGDKVIKNLFEVGPGVMRDGLLRLSFVSALRENRSSFRSFLTTLTGSEIDLLIQMLSENPEIKDLFCQLLAKAFAVDPEATAEQIQKFISKIPESILKEILPFMDIKDCLNIIKSLLQNPQAGDSIAKFLSSCSPKQLGQILNLLTQNISTASLDSFAQMLLAGNSHTPSVLSQLDFPQLMQLMTAVGDNPQLQHLISKQIKDKEKEASTSLDVPAMKNPVQKSSEIQS